MVLRKRCLAAGPAPAPVVVTRGPNPVLAGVLAGLLAGLFPFGVAAVYNRQYAKALAHALIFVGLVWGTEAIGGAAGVTIGRLLGVAILLFYIYQIVDAVRSANAIRCGQSRDLARHALP